MYKGPAEGLMGELGTTAVFAGFGRVELRTIVRLGEETRFGAGVTLVAQEDRQVAFHMILDGKVQLRRGGQPIGELGKGDFFGGPVLLGGWLYPPEVVALDATRCFILRPWSFQGPHPRPPKPPDEDSMGADGPRGKP